MHGITGLGAVLVARDLIRPVGAPSPEEKGELLRAVLDFTLLLWRSCREATDEVPLLAACDQAQPKLDSLSRLRLRYGLHGMTGV